MSLHKQLHPTYSCIANQCVGVKQLIFKIENSRMLKNHIHSWPNHNMMMLSGYGLITKEHIAMHTINLNTTLMFHNLFNQIF